MIVHTCTGTCIFMTQYLPANITVWFTTLFYLKAIVTLSAAVAKKFLKFYQVLAVFFSCFFSLNINENLILANVCGILLGLKGPQWLIPEYLSQFLHTCPTLHLSFLQLQVGMF